MAYVLTREALLLDLHAAFISAKKHKSNKMYVRKYEEHLNENLSLLCDELYNRTYKPEPSSCFVVERPKKREVFAAKFRDRIVHHLYFNYTHDIYERTFIQDTYSCIESRGTHYGIERLAKHIRQESGNYHKDCYILKLDKRGYFMHIKRDRLLSIATDSLNKMRRHRVDKGNITTWGDIRDFDFILWLTREIVMLEPKVSCKIVGRAEDWIGLDKSKSLFHTPEGCGIPIGNLTSQLFSNVYLNLFDQYVKRMLKCKHYGRYVDDSYIVSCDKDFLLSLVPKIRMFLKTSLGLDLHMGKLQIIKASYGVEFLGAYIKPYRMYVANGTITRTKVKSGAINLQDEDGAYRSINAFLGILSHYSSYNIRRNLFFKPQFLRLGTFNKEFTKLTRNPSCKYFIA